MTWLTNIQRYKNRSKTNALTRNSQWYFSCSRLIHFVASAKINSCVDDVMKSYLMFKLYLRCFMLSEQMWIYIHSKTLSYHFQIVHNLVEYSIFAQSLWYYVNLIIKGQNVSILHLVNYFKRFARNVSIEVFIYVSRLRH